MTLARAEAPLLLIELNEFNPEFLAAYGRADEPCVGLPKYSQLRRSETSAADLVEHQGPIRGFSGWMFIAVNRRLNMASATLVPLVAT